MIQRPHHTRGIVPPLQNHTASEPSTAAPTTTPSTAVPSDVSAGTTPTTTSPPTSRPTRGSQDQFETSPNTGLINTLVSLDRNTDGRVDAQEWTVGRALLTGFVSNERTVHRPDAELVSLLQERANTSTDSVFQYNIRDGKLAISIPTDRPEQPVMRVFDHQLRERGGLPDVLQTGVLRANGTETTVRHGTDPGDFYCEHAFFGAQLEASRPDSSVVTNQHGESLVGFLHLPSDPYANQTERTGYTQDSRHAGTREVVGAALRGYYEQIRAQEPDSSQPIRILLTGYDTFGSIQNNPTGDFVAHPENVDASMRRGFGDALLSSSGTLVSTEGEPPAQRWRYEVRDPQDGQTREVFVTTGVFPVADRSIDPNSSASIQDLMRRSESQAVLSMGVSPWSEYRAEHHADSGGLRRTAESVVHDESAPDTVVLRDNYSLARAITLGASSR